MNRCRFWSMIYCIAVTDEMIEFRWKIFYETQSMLPYLSMEGDNFVGVFYVVKHVLW